MKKYIFFFIVLFLLSTSCTSVSSKNLPGKKAQSFPKKMIGEFEVVYPEDFAALLGGEDAKTYVTFTKNEMILKNIEGETSTNLGEAPYFTVFKVAYSGKDILLYPLYANEGTTKEQLEPYFSNVEEVLPEIVEGEEPGDISYSVTIDDKKLDAYFKSDIPLKDPYRLKRVGGKK